MKELHLASTRKPYNLLTVLFTKAFCKSKLSCAKIEVYHYSMCSTITVTATVCGYKILLFPPFLIATVCGLLYACFQHPSPLSEISHTQEVLYLTYTEDFYSWILLPGREIYFLGTGEKMRNPYYDICNCTTKSIVYPYYVDTISIVWKYTIIMGNQKSILFPIKIHTISILWIFKIFSSEAWCFSSPW